MSYLSSVEFAAIAGVCARVARRAFAKGMWRGQTLPVMQLAGKGGCSGKVWALHLTKASPDLLALLKLPETLPSTDLKGTFKARPDDSHVVTAIDKQRILAAILAHPKGSAERAAAFRATAAQRHKIGADWRLFTERTLHDWVQAFERGGTAALMPKARSDKGQKRVLITRRWQDGCGLPQDVQEAIAAKLDKIGRGLIMKGRSDREVRRLSSTDLQRMTAEAGVTLPKKDLAALCKLTDVWVSRFADMKPARAYKFDNKAFSDRHEHRILRSPTARPMEVLMGDVHKVDIAVDKAILSGVPRLVMAAKAAEKAERVTIRVAIIGWMDGASHYLWATPVILGPGQGITQRDVAKSLFDVMNCPWGGIPRTFMIDNGSEYKALAEAVARFCAMAEMGGFGVIKSRPYSPEGKGRIEGGFGIIEQRFLSALPGYIGGDRMNSPTKSKGKPVDPYPHGPDRLISDINLAVAQFNGTAQFGDLGGLSPKGMLNAKIDQTGWTAETADAELFDLVFSKSITRDVRQGGVDFDNRTYQGPVLAKLTGAKQVEFLVPMRDPEGPMICFQDGVIHWLHAEKFALNDREGARRKDAMVKLQKEEMQRRIALADQDVDVQRLLTESADMGPVVFNPPNEWTFGVIDKAGVLGSPMTEQEAEEAKEARIRKDIEDYLAETRGNGREASGCNRNGPSSAT